MKAIMSVAVLILLTGCGTAKPYMTLSLGYQLDRTSDWYVQTDRDWQCGTNVQFNGELGVELPHDWTVGYHHQSWLFCGGPFKDGDPELYQDDIRITKKFGGIK